MPLRFRYWRGRTPYPIPSLGGAMFRPQPRVLVTVLGPTDAKAVWALLDTGADDTVFPLNLATSLGLDLSTAPTRNLTGIGPSGYEVRYAQIDLRLTDGVEYREWPAWVGFTDAPLPVATLGFAGCLQYFAANFLGDQEEVELEANSLYPGI